MESDRGRIKASWKDCRAVWDDDTTITRVANNLLRCRLFFKHMSSYSVVRFNTKCDFSSRKFRAFRVPSVDKCFEECLKASDCHYFSYSGSFCTGCSEYSFERDVESTLYSVSTPLDIEPKNRTKCVPLRSWVKYDDAPTNFDKTTIDWVRKGEEGGSETAYHWKAPHYPSCRKGHFWGGGGSGACYYAICPAGSVNAMPLNHPYFTSGDGSARKRWPSECPCVREVTETGSEYPVWEYYGRHHSFGALPAVTNLAGPTHRAFIIIFTHHLLLSCLLTNDVLWFLLFFFLIFSCTLFSVDFFFFLLSSFIQADATTTWIFKARLCVYFSTTTASKKKHRLKSRSTVPC